MPLNQLNMTKAFISAYSTVSFFCSWWIICRHICLVSSVSCSAYLHSICAMQGSNTLYTNSWFSMDLLFVLKRHFAIIDSGHENYIIGFYSGLSLSKPFLITCCTRRCIAFQSTGLGKKGVRFYEPWCVECIRATAVRVGLEATREHPCYCSVSKLSS